MSYIDNEILERLIGTMIEGFARIEKKLDQMNRLKETDCLIMWIWQNSLVCHKEHWHVTGKRARLNITRLKRTGNHSISPRRYRVSFSSEVRT